MAYRMSILAVLSLLPLLGSATPARAADESAADEALLQRQLGGADADRVIAYLKEQLLSEPSQANLKKLIEQMGDRKFAVRQEATHKLVAAGIPALPLLREATKHPDKEIASRAKRCLADIEAGAGYDVPRAAVRHLVRLRHEKAVETLLTVYPAALSEAFQADILQGLKTVGVSGTTVHPLLKQALDDPDAARRALAVQVLLASTDRELRKKIREKLTDADPTVR